MEQPKFDTPVLSLDDASTMVYKIHRKGDSLENLRPDIVSQVRDTLRNEIYKLNNLLISHQDETSVVSNFFSNQLIKTYQLAVDVHKVDKKPFLEDLKSHDPVTFVRSKGQKIFTLIQLNKQLGKEFLNQECQQDVRDTLQRALFTLSEILVDMDHFDKALPFKFTTLLKDMCDLLTTATPGYYNE